MSEPIQTDAQLIRGYLAGRQSAFQILYERYEKPLYGFLFRFVRERAAADDLFQQTWLKIIRALPRYEERGTFSSWLFGIANNCGIDYVRRKEVCLKDDLASGEGMDMMACEQNLPDQQLVDRESRKWLQDAIDQLPVEQKQVILLRLYGEVPFREIALQMNCSINTVLGRMHYAVQNLKKIYEKRLSEA